MPNAVSSELCDEILEKCNKLEKHEGDINEHGEFNSKSIRKSKIAWVHDHNIKNIIYDLGCFINYNAFWFNLYSNSNTFDVQFTEYSEEYEGTYDWHLDSISNNPYIFDRKLSIILLLNSMADYEGGNICIKTGQNTQNDDLMNLSKGTVVAFPSFLLHKIEPITKGTRNSLVAWLNGPAWQSLKLGK